MTMTALVLASGSPRRRALMARLGLVFTVAVSGIDEVIEPNLAAAEQVIRLAEAKARAVAERCDQGLVIGADTAVVLGDRVFGKPGDAAAASVMLRELGGRVHRVLTGVVVFDATSGRVERGVVETEVRMCPMDDAAIARYVATGEPFDKAGGYGIQGGGGALVAGFAGCYMNVVGLPLCELAALLGRCGVIRAGDEDVCRLPGGDPCPRLGWTRNGSETAADRLGGDRGGPADRGASLPCRSGSDGGRR